CLQYSSPPFTF
nr:immunoglobulin light chain junction region [Macaca mulatta]